MGQGLHFYYFGLNCFTRYILVTTYFLFWSNQIWLNWRPAIQWSLPLPMVSVLCIPLCVDNKMAMFWGSENVVLLVHILSHLIHSFFHSFIAGWLMLCSDFLVNDDYFPSLFLFDAVIFQWNVSIGFNCIFSFSVYINLWL